MPNYIKWEDVAAVYPSIAKDKQAEINSNHIPFASAWIDGRAGAKFTVPFTPVPLLIQDIAVDLVYWRLTRNQDGAVTLKEWIDERLEGLVNGTITLTDPATGAALGGASSQVRLTTKGWRSSFGMNNPIDWHEDERFDVNVQVAAAPVSTQPDYLTDENGADIFDESGLGSPIFAE